MTTVLTTVPATLAPTTTAAATTTVNPSTFNATTFCTSRIQSRQALPYATQCKQYVYCYLNNGMKGAIYTCPGRTLFDRTKGSCATGVVCVE
jgi:hypothetical protein